MKIGMWILTEQLISRVIIMNDHITSRERIKNTRRSKIIEEIIFTLSTISMIFYILIIITN